MCNGVYEGAHMSSALLAASLVAGASFLNAEEPLEWYGWTVYSLLFVALLAVSFARVPSIVLVFSILPTFIALAADDRVPPIGTGTAYALLCLASATITPPPSTQSTLRT